MSLASARSILDAAADSLAITPLVLSRDGKVLSAPASMAALGMNGSPALPDGAPARQLAEGLSRLGEDGFDVVFPLLHGPFGEDGSVQGLLKVMGLPFIGSDVLGSAVGMDKLMMKAVFAAHVLPQVGYLGIARSAWARDPEGELARLEALASPLFVKPANLGSSIGIHRVDDRDQLAGAITDALRYDRRVIVEEGVIGARELEVAVLGNDLLRLSPVGEVTYAGGFYDFDTKYSDGRAALTIPAAIPEELAERVGALAERAFRAVDAAGLARVDFFYRPQDGGLWLNEINTMPGFTRHSMYPKLWEAGGLPYAELVRELVALALEPR